MNDAIKEKVRRILLDICGNIEFESEKGLISNEVIDSLSILNLMVKLSEEFNIEVEAEDVNEENFDSLDKISEYIEKKSS